MNVTTCRLTQTRFIEVKGRAAGAETVTVTKNEILTALNKPEEFILAIVELDGDASTVRYVRKPFQRSPILESQAAITLSRSCSNKRRNQVERSPRQPNNVNKTDHSQLQTF